jgi:integrase
VVPPWTPHGSVPTVITAVSRPRWVNRPPVATWKEKSLQSGRQTSSWARGKRMLVSLSSKDTHHGTQRPDDCASRTLEQGQADRREVPAAAKSRLVDKNETANADRKRDLALFNLAIDRKLRGCDVVALRIDDVAPSGYALDRATIRQKKTGRPARFELTDQTRSAVDDYLRMTGRKPGQFLFAGRGDGSHGLTTRQYARLVHEWVAGWARSGEIPNPLVATHQGGVNLPAHGQSSCRPTLARTFKDRKHCALPRHRGRRRNRDC